MNLGLPPNGFQQAPQMQLATPFNDVQLVAMIAGQLIGSSDIFGPKDAVAIAMDIVAEACVQAGGSAIQRKIQKLQEE